ncbi:nuclear transport factor 2-like isoform X2 [Apium graveolens]|uniref:nuclear transport factor 2-like isoform X2 n=1 Tax=Apium graveolens TaxID=4045 RepID=UPI003D7BA191
MATPFHLHLTAAQVGTYFVGQYYNALQNTPEVVHQFYTESSTVVRTDGNIRETASARTQINALIMSLNYTGIEIKTANSLESWNGGVLIMVSGSVLLKDFKGRRKFVQTFFLAPQESGFFVLSDIFHFIEEDQIHQYPVAYIAPSIHDPKLHVSNAIQEAVPTYMLGGDFQAIEFVGSSNAKENPPINNYSFPEQRLPQVPETDSTIKGSFAMQSNGSLQSTINSAQEHPSTPIEEPAEEPHKHTYASIVSKGHSVAVHVHSSFKKTTSPPSEWDYVPEPSSNQQSFTSSVALDSSGRDAVEQVSVVEDEVKIKSVYVRNVPSTVSASEIEEEFKKFGRLKPDGVAIRTRQPKELGVCYAFVEFEDAAGVQNAIKASTVELAGQQAFIEERKADRVNAFRGGRGRGRSRGSYHMDSSKGRFSVRNFSRGNGQNGDYSRPRGNGNGYYRPSQRQERVFSGNQQVSRNGHNPSE